MSARKTLSVAEKDALKRAAFPILLKQHNIEIFGHGQSLVKHPNIEIFGSSHGIASSPNRGNVLCPFHAETRPSCSIDLERGTYNCFSCGAKGDAIDFVRQKEGCSFPAAIAILQKLVGDAPTSGIDNNSPAKTPRRFTPKSDRLIAGILKRSESIFDTHAARYLSMRGIDAQEVFQALKTLVPKGGTPPLEDLRYHPSVLYAHNGVNYGEHPCMIAIIRCNEGKIIGLHRTWLDSRHPQKLEVRCKELGELLPPRKVLGAAIGAIRLFHATHTMAVAEGVETALSVTQATGMPCWSGVSLPSLASPHGMLPPAGCKTIFFAADNDNEKPNAERLRRQKTDACKRLATAGVVVKVAVPKKGKDFNDMLQHESLVRRKLICEESR